MSFQITGQKKKKIKKLVEEAKTTSTSSDAMATLEIKTDTAGASQDQKDSTTSNTTSSPLLPRIFDTHCHIGLIRREREAIPLGAGAPKFIGNVPADLVYDASVKSLEAFHKNVQRIMIVGICDKTSLQAAHVCALIQRESAQFKALHKPEGWLSPWSGFSAGIHPHDAHNFDVMWPAIEGLARGGVALDPLFNSKESAGATAGGGGGGLKPVAIGETGLDYFKSQGTKEQQKRNLKAHVLLAQELGLPIILHVRDAYDDIFAHFAEWGITKLPGVLHCFSSDERHMRMGINLGLKISFCGTLTYPKSHDLHHCMTICPPQSMVFETDAPYLPPQIMRGKINTPALITEVVASAAKLRQEDPVALADQAWKNSCELFQIPIS